MAIHDEVEHNAIAEVDRRNERPLNAKEREAKDLVLKAGETMKPGLCQLSGAAVVFFYRSIAGEYFEYQAFASLENVRSDLALAGLKELGLKVAGIYGIEAPKKRNEKKVDGSAIN